MSLQDIFLFGIFGALGFFRISNLPLFLTLSIASAVVFMSVHQRSGPFGLFEPNILSSVLTTATMGIVFIFVYFVAYLIAVQIRRRSE
jgi:hypothetical protein